MTRALDPVEDKALSADVGWIVLVAVGHEDDVHGATLHVVGAHKVSPIADVVVDHILHHGDDLGSPMMVKVSLADELGDVALIDIRPVQAVGRPAIKVPVRPQRLIGRHDRPRDVDCLEFDRQEISDCLTLSHIGDHEIDVSESRHLDFASDLRTGGRVARPAVLNHVGHEVNGVEPLGANADLLRFTPNVSANRANGIRLASERRAALDAFGTNEGAKKTQRLRVEPLCGSLRARPLGETLLTGAG